MFVARNDNICIYESKNLFLSFNGPFSPNFHKEILTSFAGSRRFSVGIFLCPYSSGFIYGAGIEAFIRGSLGGRTNHGCDVKKERGCLQAAGIRFKMSFRAYDDPEYRKPTVGGSSPIAILLGRFFAWRSCVQQ